MIAMTLTEIADAVGGTVTDDDASGPVTVTGPAFLDSRTVEPGGLFVAVAGEHVDGHDYAAGAVASGAAAVLASRPVGVPAVLVDDPVTALGRLARHVLDRVADVTVLAVTGSQGKTGTKDHLAHVVAGLGPTVATTGNHNNELGVPLTVLGVTEETRYLVVEMGARGIGHVAELCRIAPPHVSAVINVGTAHVGEFGSRANIAAAKGEIIEALPASGTAVLNADDEYTSVMGPRTSARVLTFGTDGDVTARGVRLDALGHPTFEIAYDGRTAPVTLQQIGTHQVANALAAAAMALGAGADLDLVAERLSSEPASSSRWRMEPHVRADGLLVVNDAYNANPESMRSAVETLAHLGEARQGRTVAVLGDMFELGETSEAGHRSVGTVVAERGIDLLVTVGEQAAHIAAAAREHGGWSGEAIVTASRDEALTRVRENVAASDVVLVKASRGVALEHLVDDLLEGTTAR